MDNRIAYQGGFSAQHDVSHLPAGLYRIDILKDKKTESVLGVKQ